MKIDQKDVVIIGSGLTGLTAAYYLRKQGKNVLVIEKENKIGGVIQTHRKEGFVFESGPNTGVLSNPEVVELLEELHPACELEIANEAAKRRWVWKGQSWKELPSGLMGGITTPLFTLKDKLNLLGEPFRKKGNNPDETLAELVKRRMGQSFLDYAVDPFILGIYAGDPSYLVPRYALPKLYNLEQNYGSFIGGALKKKKQETTLREKKATREVFSVKGGLSNFTEALADHIGKEKIILGNTDLSVTKTEDAYHIQFDEDEVIAKSVVYSGGSHGLQGLFDFISDEEVKTLNNLLYAKVVMVSLGFNVWEGKELNAFGGLVPFKENRDVLGVLLPSAFLSGRAPQEGALLTVFLGGVRKPSAVEMTDEEIRATVAKEITQMMEMKTYHPDFIEIFRYEHAIPQYGKSTGDRLQMIESLEEKYPGLLLAGNMRDGIGMADRVKQGYQIAEKLTASALLD